MPVKPLSFKGDRKTSKKRKHRDENDADTSLTTTSNNSTNKDDDDSWTMPSQPSDISGPVILVLPTTPLTALSSDSLGNIFASPLENVVDNIPETAEPHDVRQVWVANSIPGTGGQVTLKASHGCFLSCDSLGVLGARREARGVEEGFVVEDVSSDIVDHDDGRRKKGQRWRFRTFATNTAEGEKARKYICAIVENPKNKQLSSTFATTAATADVTPKYQHEDDEEESTRQKKIAISIRGDGDVDSDTTGIIIKMQARFLPRTAAQKEAVARDKVSRSELERAVGRKLNDDEVKRLKRARKDGTYHEEVLDVRVKGKHDKFAS